MGDRIHQVLSYVEAVRTLRRGGATWPSLLLYPIRRRMSAPRNQLTIKPGIYLIAPPDEPLLTMVDEIWTKQCYLPRSFEFAPGQTVVDIGANVGVFTVWTATRNPNGRVIAVEPSLKMFRCLTENVLQNRLNNVVTVQAVCAGQCGETELYARGPEVMNTLYRRDYYGSTFCRAGSVKALTLNAIFEQYNISTCDLLKLDCEGAEYEILMQAGDETLSRIANITMEYHIGLNDHTPEELAGYLTSHGFVVQWSQPIDVESGYLSAYRRQCVK